MVLFTLLNLCFELGEEVISFLHTEIPQSYRDIFRIYIVNRYMMNRLCIRCQTQVSYQNRLSHQYAGLDREDLIAIVQKIDTIRIYVSMLIEKSQEIV
ncbi:MAG: DUF86 domain-containing protein [Methanospirillaceae archaeon]|nr:DUF86 domain-containing protein [Methanospirillaceae archaeon]